MRNTIKTVFGDAISIQDNLSVVFSLNLYSNGTIHENYGVEIFYLNVLLLTSNNLKIEKTFRVATGTDGHGQARSFRPELFRDLHAGRFTEEKRGKLAGFLLKKYEDGNVTKEDMITELEGLMGTGKKAMSVCRFCNSRA